MKTRTLFAVVTCAFAFFLLGLTFCTASASAETGLPKQLDSVSPASVTESALAAPVRQGFFPTATLRAASGVTIEFQTNNGDPNIGPVVQSWIPHLVLYRDGNLTPAISRTLIVDVTGIEVPPPGVTVTLKLETQHGDPDQGGLLTPTIPIWREAQWITNTWDHAIITHTTFVIEFGDAVLSGTMPIPTPTDCFQYVVLVDGTPLFDSVPYAFLLENQISAPLDAQNELLVRYYDMAPMGHKDNWGGAPGTNWLLRKDVRPYVENQLVQIIKDAFDAMVNEWGFGPPHPQWRDWASGWADGRSNVLTVDIGHPDTWFHTGGGVHHAIHLQPYAGVEDGYDDVSQWYKSILAQFTNESKHLSKTFLWLVEVLIERTRHLVYEQARAMTWFYFWRAGMADLGCEGAGLAQCAGVAPEDVYQEALKNTKSFMATVVWPEFKTWLTDETGLFILAPPEETE